MLMTRLALVLVVGVACSSARFAARLWIASLLELFSGFLFEFSSSSPQSSFSRHPAQRFSPSSFVVRCWCLARHSACRRVASGSLVATDASFLFCAKSWCSFLQRPLSSRLLSVPLTILAGSYLAALLVCNHKAGWRCPCSQVGSCCIGLGGFFEQDCAGWLSSTRLATLSGSGCPATLVSLLLFLHLVAQVVAPSALLWPALHLRVMRSERENLGVGCRLRRWLSCWLLRGDPWRVEPYCLR